MSRFDPEHSIFRLSATGSEERTIVAVAGELDLATVDEFATALREHLARGPVLLDMGALSFMDSSGVRALDAVVREVDREGWTFGVRSQLQDGVRRILEMTGLLALLPLEKGEGG